MNTIPLYQVDAFAERPFEGNPAAVCLLPEARSETWMQSVAQEMNLSETAFLVPRQDGFDLRWYTPVREVELCGHATLASAHVLWEAGVIPQDTEARFHSKSGVLLAGQRHGKIWLDFPADPVEPAEPPDGLAEAIGTKPQYVGRGRFDYLVELESERDIRALSPRFDLFEGVVARGVITTAKATTAPYDFVSRYFAPAYGIDEDPVTGSAHCTLACHWSTRLDKTEFDAFQASARGGVLALRLAGDRVQIGGRAVTVFQGELRA